ncbi:MAG: hypothetical protein HKN87_02570 [Saprospiraceae bacterium]|nr:hypothetical protein [Saprospiraceae bacterium]
MKRKDFIQKSSILAFSTSAFGLIRWNGENYVGDTPTTSDILGPFYRPGAPFRNNIIPVNSKGTPLNLRGIVLGDDGKTPLEDAIVEIWQCDENRYYDNTSDDFRFRGALRTNADGRYHFNTIVPVPYKVDMDDDDSSWRPAHIHMRISSEAQQDLVTQIYLKGDQYIDTDASASSPDAIHRILDLTRNADNEQELIFDVVMTENIPLSDEVYQKITGLYQTERNIIEYIKSDDLLLVKKNGQIVRSLKYVGNNTFEGINGNPKVSFRLFSDGKVEAITHWGHGKKSAGSKFLKY